MNISYLNGIASHFQFEGDLIYAEPYGNGHINDTYAVYFKRTAERPLRYILQKINRHVFQEPEKLMQNISGVTAYLHQKIGENGGDPLRESLTLVPASDGGSFYRDPEGEYWRAYLFIEGTTAFDQVEKPSQLLSAARAFGKFQNLLCDYPAATLYEVLPKFHDTTDRFNALTRAVREDKLGRVAEAREEISFACAREKETGFLTGLRDAGRLPVRVTHNDTKLNNVLLDNRTGDGVCVIDLDTVMPGLAAFDFGDSIRFGASTAAEDEMDLSRVEMDLGLFEMYAKGYLGEAGKSLTPTEAETLPMGAKLMTYECGVRFLTDYLQGDTYFKIHRERQNLDRCRTQFKLVADMEVKMDRMKALVAGFYPTAK